MGKILAIIFLGFFAWYAVPVILRGIWFAPTFYPDYWWGPSVYDYDEAVARDGGGWFNFDPRKGGTSGQSTASIIDSL